MQKYPELKNLIQVVKVLDDLKIPYYITGGFAVSIYGRPRFTADIDMVIKILDPDVAALTAALQRIFTKGYVDQNQIQNALKNVSEFNVIDPESGLKIDFFMTKNDEFEQECFKKSQLRDLGHKMNFTSPENLILSKLIWYQQSQSTRQLEDIQSVMDVQKRLDRAYLILWINKLSLQKEWQKLKKKDNC